ncbi:MAG: polysaccharide pyruvyl transferase family protein [Planctomycetota bacterium]
MSRKSKSENKRTKICLLGVSFDTGNMGVSALAESSIKIIVNRWPNAEVTLLGTGITDAERSLVISGREVRVRIRRLRFCKNIFLRSHCLMLLLNAMLIKLIPLRSMKNLLSRVNPCVKMLIETDKAFDITGGDSFSDIYGMRRFLIFGFLQKWLITQYRKELVLLPQTYGPWSRPVTRLMARLILRRSGTVYARDHAGVRDVKDLLGNQDVNGKVRFMPDVAFVLDPHKPDNIDIGHLAEVRSEDSVVVGLNVSGLLLSGGYTRENMFRLKIGYGELIYSAVESMMKDKKVLVLLVPHVFTANRPVEDDPSACAEVFEKLNERFPDRVFLTKGNYDHADIKYVIGLCDFFIGSRMHACIAALSQCIPAVGIAYSKKFHGVFESIGLGHCVAEAYRRSGEEVLSVIEAAFESREQTTRHLKEVIPGIKANILDALEA